MNNILASQDNPFNLFHEPGHGILEHYLKGAQEKCCNEDVYKKFPSVVHLFAFSSSNGCDDVYKQTGRRTKKRIKSYIIVLRSTVKCSTLNTLPVGLKEFIETWSMDFTQYQI